MPDVFNSRLALISLDADDTLWTHSDHFAAGIDRFVDLVGDIDADARQTLIETTQANLAVYGFGAKGFALSMLETALALTDGDIRAEAESILAITRELLDHPIDLLDGVDDMISALSNQYHLVLITKGDLFEQEGKLARSGLGERFDHIEIVSEKTPAAYRRVLSHFSVSPAQFVMIGDSMRFDVWPPLEIGAHAIHVPYDNPAWSHDQVERSQQTAGRAQPRIAASARDVPQRVIEIEKSLGSAVDCL